MHNLPALILVCVCVCSRYVPVNRNAYIFRNENSKAINSKTKHAKMLTLDSTLVLELYFLFCVRL